MSDYELTICYAHEKYPNGIIHNQSEGCRNCLDIRRASK